MLRRGRSTCGFADRLAPGWVVVERRIGNLGPDVSGALVNARDVPLAATLTVWTVAHGAAPCAEPRMGPAPLTPSPLGTSVLSPASVARAPSAPMAMETALRTLLLFGLFVYLCGAACTR